MAHFEPGNLASAPASLTVSWFLFVGSDLVIRDTGAAVERPAPRAVPATSHYLGMLDGVPCFAGRITLEELPEGARPETLRNVYSRIPEVEWRIAGRGIQLLEWDRTHQFCGSCGRKTKPVASDRSRRCDDCELNFYPRIAPAMIVLIHRGEEALLAKPKMVARDFYSTLAGFVEPGESLEEALEREVFEEVGLRVKNLRYFGSQPWPFPHSLMLGYHAEWASGEIRIDAHEIADAKWFRYDALPNIPPKASIARKLIDAWRDPLLAGR